MRLLFDDKFAPITSAFGFLETDCSYAADILIKWLGPIYRERGSILTRKPISGNFEELVKTLLPLTANGISRYLLVPTIGPWVAFFDNGLLGTDRGPLVYLPSITGTRGVYFIGILDTFSGAFPFNKGRNGIVSFELYTGGATLKCQRSINVSREDLGKWEFEEYGAPLGFEEIENYKKRRVQQRFTLEMLDNYLKYLGISAFEETFYLPPENNVAILVEEVGPPYPNAKYFDLKEARASLEIDENVS